MNYSSVAPYLSKANGKFEWLKKKIKTESIRTKVPRLLDDAKRFSYFHRHHHYQRLHSSVGFVIPYDRLLGQQETIFQHSMQSSRRLAQEKSRGEYGLIVA
jgi:hypothetical protein